MITLNRFDTKDALLEAALQLALPVMKDGEDTPVALIVPGGRTPKPLFDALAAQGIQAGPRAFLGYTDERHVPETDPQSNYALTVAMIRSLQLPPSRVLRVQTELSLDEAAVRYHEAWRDFFDGGGEIPLALLGLGDDGHTCSLFTAEQVRAYAPGVYAAPLRRESGPHRVTVTPALLERVQHVVFLVTGSDKAAVVDGMLRDPSSVTAALAVEHAPRVSLWYAPRG